MKTPKKIWKGIAGKLKSRKGSQIVTSEGVEESKAPDMPKDVEEVKEEQEEITNVDKATELNTQLYKNINKDFQPIFESSEKAQNTAIETIPQEPNTPSSAESPFDSGFGNSVNEKSSKRSFQPIVAGIVGAVLLVSCVASYLLIEYSKMHVIAVIGGIVGLACVSFALYSVLKPNTKLEKVENVEQHDVKSLSSPTTLKR